MTSYPIQYKTIPTQYAFLVTKTEHGATVTRQPVSTQNVTQDFPSVEEAREWVEQLETLI